MNDTIALRGPAAALGTKLARTDSMVPSPTTPGAAGTAQTITRHASQQTFLTIRFLADRQYRDAAFQLYAYFRWLDDRLDEDLATAAERQQLLQQQRLLVEQCYRGIWPADVGREEAILVELIHSDGRRDSGLGLYIDNMMGVMAFDSGRRGRLISAAELDEYTSQLAVAVTEALHYCIGHGRAAPTDERRYHAVQGAHIVHMLRDALEDTAVGMVNVPGEYLSAHSIAADDFTSNAYRAWVKERASLARALFASGKRGMAEVESRRCRLAGYAYIARFEIVLDLIEQDDFVLRASYPERQGRQAWLKTAWAASQLWRAGS